MTSRQLGRDSQVWDPGARILIYSENNNNNNIDTGLSPGGGHLNVSVNYNVNAKEKNRSSCIMHQSSKPVSTRASPNKSQDSGFSDSGESESSSANSEANKASGHVTKVYFYSNNSESHYQSPSSLPVYSSVTKINTATGNREGHERGHTLPDTARPASNKRLHKVPAYRHKIYQDIRIIQDNAREVTKSFAELCRLLSGQTRKEKLVSSIKYLENQVQSLINLNCVTKFRLSGSQFGELQSLPGLRIISGSGHDFGSLESEHNNVIMREHQKILSYIHDLKFCAAHGHSRKGHVSEMVKSATKFGSCITVLVEEMLSSKVGHIVTSLEPSPGQTRDSLEQSLVSLTSLGLEGNHLCRLMTKHGAVSLLVSILSQENCSVRAATLRALATLCSVLEAIRQLEEVRGVEVIARLLGDLTISEADRAEAAGVLAQVTSPWIEDNDYVLGVTENAFTLVRDLTTMCSATKCDETFLLCSAALANLSFLSPLILTAMSAQDTVLILLQYLTHNVSPSIYIQDQVATVLANMAARPDTQESLLSCNIVAVLLHLLAASPGSEELPILAATQRVQQKAAIAIGRLSSQPIVMSGLMSAAGLERLVELSVCKKARLDSDSTLVAVITAVRKISQSQNISHLLTNLGASELLESCLLSSFKLFSRKHESFV